MIRLLKFAVIYLLLLTEPCFPICRQKINSQQFKHWINVNVFGELHRWVLEVETMLTFLAKIPGVLLEWTVY